MMADQRGLRGLEARRSDHALFTGDHPCIEQQEIDRLTPLDQLGDGGLNAGRRVQIQLQRREDLFLGLGRELSGRFLDLGQLAVAFSGEQAGCRITEPGRGAGDERERIFHSVSLVKGEARKSPRVIGAALSFSNCYVIYCRTKRSQSRSVELDVSEYRQATGTPAQLRRERRAEKGDAGVLVEGLRRRDD